MLKSIMMSLLRNKYILGLITATIFAILLVLFLEERKEKKRYKNNSETLLNAEKHYVDSINGLTFRVGVLELTKKEMVESSNEKINALMSELRRQKIKVRNLKEAYIGNFQANGEGISRIDTFYCTDTLYKEPIRVIRDNWSDGYLKLTTTIQQPNIRYKYIYNDTVLVYLDEKKIGKFKFKNIFYPREKKDIITSTTKNPNSSLEITFIRKMDKRLFN